MTFKYAMIPFAYQGHSFTFETHPSLFSPSNIDSGTLAMLSKVHFHPDDKVLDLGCGYGVVGIVAGKLLGGSQVTMSDISDVAIHIARTNATMNRISDCRFAHGHCYETIKDHDFSLILINPPYHSDFSVAKEFIEEGFMRLKLNGRLIMVTKRKEWYKKK